VKFIAWFYKFRNPSRPSNLTFNHMFIHKNVSQLYVTGPCRDCDFYNDERYWVGVFRCGNEKSAYYKRVCGDGCIHFEETNDYS